MFADYFLFEDVLASDRAIPGRHPVPGAPGDRPQGQRQDGRFTTTDLSTGQRKRLALVNAWLDERPVLVFDEWAADQDPTFRRIFYTELLPDLKRMGKTIVVISHDDRYFDIADQLIRLQTGRITHDAPPSPDLRGGAPARPPSFPATSGKAPQAPKSRSPAFVFMTTFVFSRRRRDRQ